MMKAIHKFLVRQNDTNLWNALFGGKLLSEMDVAGYFVVRKILKDFNYDYITTAGFDKIKFVKPAFIGDLIFLEAEIIKFGKTSFTVAITAYREDKKGEKEKIMDSEGVFVCMKDGKPHPHNIKDSAETEFITSNQVEKIEPFDPGVNIVLSNGKSVTIDNETLEKCKETKKVDQEFKSYSFPVKKNE